MNGIISDYQREMILFILLADYYKHGANNAEDDTLVLEWNQSIDAVLEDAQRTGGPLPLPSQITASDSSRTLTVQRLEWYDHSMNQTGIRRIEEIGPIQGSVSPKRLPPPPLTLLTIPCVCQETLSSQTMS